MRPSRIAALLGSAFLASCGGDQIGVSVDVISDWEPGIDFVSVETEVSKSPFEGASVGEVRQASLPVSGTEPFVEGVRVAELADVGAGRTFVRVSLRDASGRAIASRVLDVVLERSFAATILLTRSCRDVECPAPVGAPELSECQGGECVDPRCSPATPEHCPPPRCASDGDCATELSWCAGERTCRRGYCLCREPMVPRDAGMDASTLDGGFDAGLDAGPACATLDCANPACAGAPCDDGSACTTGDACSAGACIGSAIACDDGNACTDDACNPASGCVFTNNAAACNDGNACTSGDRCTGGTCSGTAVSCDDGNACTNDSCNPATGCVSAYRGEHATCGAAHLRCCGGGCVDIRASTSHCGGCGLACNPGFTCGMRAGLPTCQCSGPHATCSGSTGSCSGMSLLCSCDPLYGGSCPAPMTCYAMASGADVCTY